MRKDAFGLCSCVDGVSGLVEALYLRMWELEIMHCMAF